MHSDGGRELPIRKVYEIDLTVGKHCSSGAGVRSAPTSIPRRPQGRVRRRSGRAKLEEWRTLARRETWKNCLEKIGRRFRESELAATPSASEWARLIPRRDPIPTPVKTGGPSKAPGPKSVPSTDKEGKGKSVESEFTRDLSAKMEARTYRGYLIHGVATAKGCSRCDAINADRNSRWNVLAEVTQCDRGRYLQRMDGLG